MKKEKWKALGNNSLDAPLDHQEKFIKRQKQFRQTMQIDRMPVNKPKNHNLPKRNPSGEEPEE